MRIDSCTTLIQPVNNTSEVLEIEPIKRAESVMQEKKDELCLPVVTARRSSAFDCYTMVEPSSNLKLPWKKHLQQQSQSPENAEVVVENKKTLDSTLRVKLRRNNNRNMKTNHSKHFSEEDNSVSEKRSKHKFSLQNTPVA